MSFKTASICFSVFPRESSFFKPLQISYKTRSELTARLAVFAFLIAFIGCPFSKSLIVSYALYYMRLSRFYPLFYIYFTVIYRALIVINRGFMAAIKDFSAVFLFFLMYKKASRIEKRDYKTALNPLYTTS